MGGKIMTCSQRLLSSETQSATVVSVVCGVKTCFLKLLLNLATSFRLQTTNTANTVQINYDQFNSNNCK